MTLIEKTVKSEKLGRENSVKVLVPDSGREFYPTVYFQHGLGDDENTLWQRTKLAEYAADYELIIVTADAEASWFCNDRRKAAEASGAAGAVLWEDYFTYELPECIEENFPAAPKAVSRGQCGFSMGGYGAMMMTLLHPDRFSAVSVHSGSFLFGHEYRTDRPERAAFMEAVAPPGSRYDLFASAGGFSGWAENVPAIRFDVGSGYHLLEHNRRFHSFLDNNLIPHSYIENSGSHTWSYVDSHLRQSLDFFKRVLKIY